MKKDFGKKLIMAPLPVLIVATYDENGTPNAMNVAWGGQCTDTNIALNLSKNHKTTENLRAKKAFTVSIADKAHLVASDYFGIVSGHKENKIEKSGMKVEKSRFVDAPVICDYPLTYECRVVSMEECFGEVRVVGEVVNMQADASVLDDKGKVDLSKLQPLSFDSSANTYRVIGENVGKAFKDGAQLKNK